MAYFATAENFSDSNLLALPKITAGNLTNLPTGLVLDLLRVHAWSASYLQMATRRQSLPSSVDCPRCCLRGLSQLLFSICLRYAK